MSEEKLREAIKAVRSEVSSLEASNLGPWKSRSDTLRLLCDAAESTLPKTKMVEVWHVEYVDAETLYPAVDVRRDRDNGTFGAEARAERLRKQPSKYLCIRVTGPHQQEVPA